MNYYKEIKKLEERVDGLERNVVTLNDDGLLVLVKHKEEPKKEKFTEDEKVILRNLPEEYRWIVRDCNGELWIFVKLPHKDKEYMRWNDLYCKHWLDLYVHLFQSIQWEDEEPCEFRKYL